MNKFLIFIAAFLLTALFSNGQTTAGSQTIGLNLGFSAGKTNESPGAQQTGDGSSFIEHNNDFSCGPVYSLFIANDLDIGVALNFVTVSQKTTDNNFGNPLN
jgi:hypothetical protein